MHVIFDPFSEPLLRRALLELVLLGAACGPLGVWVVSYRQAYAAESFAHAMLPGLVLAALAGAPLVLGAAGGALAGAGAVSLAARDPRVDSDAAVAVAVSALLGGGVLIGLAPAAPARLGDLLFGDLLGAGDADLAAAGGLAVAVAAALACSHRRLVLAAFDAGTARALGASPRRTELLLLGVLALAVVAAVQGLGNLLVVALLVAPGAAALRLAATLPAALLLAAALAVIAGVGGLYASYYLDLAAGPAVALAAVLVYALAGLVPQPPRRRASASQARPAASSATLSS